MGWCRSVERAWRLRQQRAYAIAQPVGWPLNHAVETRARGGKVPRRYAPEAVVWEGKEEWEIRDEMERRLRVRGWLAPVPVVVPFVENPRNPELGALMKKTLAVLIAFVAPLAFAAQASAQTLTITGLTVTVQNSAGVQVGTPQTAVWPLAAGSCNLVQTVDPTANVINPQFARLEDPAFPASPSPLARECRANFASYFSSFPAATGYRFTLKFLYSDGIVSGASNVSGPFDVPLPHPAPTGVGVR